MKDKEEIALHKTIKSMSTKTFFSEVIQCLLQQQHFTVRVFFNSIFSILFIYFKFQQNDTLPIKVSEKKIFNSYIVNELLFSL